MKQRFAILFIIAALWGCQESGDRGALGTPENSAANPSQGVKPNSVDTSAAPSQPGKALSKNPERELVITERLTGEHMGSADLLVASDFDGDGVVDEASFVKKGKKIQLRIQRDDANEDVIFKTNSIANIGIRKISPGKYDSACARGFGKPCADGQAEYYIFKHPALELFQYESGSRVYYWDGSQFSVAFLSD